MRFGSIITGVLTASLVAGCATAPRGSVSQLGTTGANLAAALSASTNKIATEVAADPALDVFYRTYTDCKGEFVRDPHLKACPTGSTGNDTGQLQSAKDQHEYARILRLEVLALAAMGNAYSALKAEADYDEATDFGGALDGAAKGVTALAQAALPGAQFIPVAELVKVAGTEIGARRQRQRIMEANDRLQAVATIYLMVLESQKNTVESAIEATQDTRGKAVQALIDEGVVSRSDLFAKLLGRANIAMASDAPAKISGSQLLKDSIDPALRQSAIDELQTRLQQYDTSIAALRALIATHEQFRSSGAANTASVDALISQLAAEAAQLPSPPAAAKTEPKTDPKPEPKTAQPADPK